MGSIWSLTKMEIALAKPLVQRNSPSSPEIPPRRLFTLKAFSERHSSFLTLPALTNQVFRAKERYGSRAMIPGNGLAEAGAIVRINGRVLIDEDRYFAWIDSRQQ